MNNRNHLDNMFESLAMALKPVTELMVLGAIWVDKKVTVLRHGEESTTTKRISKGDIVGVEGGWVTDYLHHNQWVILECRGNLSNTRFEIDLNNIDTGETKTISL
jgi:hypothetical protein